MITTRRKNHSFFSWPGKRKRTGGLLAAGERFPVCGSTGSGALPKLLLGMVSALFVLHSGNVAEAGERVFVLEEHLDRNWRDQMLTYAFEAELESCHPHSVELEGPEGALPVQLSEIENWEGTPFLRRAKVLFYVKELKPLSTRRYVLRYGPEAQSSRVESDLTVTVKDGIAEITTPRIGVRLRVGNRVFDTPAAAAEAPAPMSGIRMRNGVWTGEGHLYGDASIVSYNAELTAEGPVFAEVVSTYSFDDGNTVRYRFRIPAGDRAVEVDGESSENRPESGWDLTLGGDTVRFVEAVRIAHRSYKAGENKVTLSASDSPFAELAPWAGWWWGAFPTLLRLKADDAAAGQVHLNSRDAGAWVEPKPLAESADFRKWAPGSMGWVWGRMHRSRIPLFAGENGSVTLRSNHRQGVRRWTLSLNEEGTGQLETYTGGDQTAHTPNPRLDEVKDMVLAWPDGEPSNPHLFLDAESLQTAVDEFPSIGDDLHNVKGLAGTLNALGKIDLMRRPMGVAGRYDALINSDRITAEQRALFRAQAAYLAYRLASPLTWSVERGYTSGNPNMSLSFSANAGMLALALRDHPQSEAWINTIVERMDFWLETVVDEQGYWPESSHYARVSWANMVHFGIAASLAGVRDYLGDPKYRKMAEFYEKTLTPADPMRTTSSIANRVNPPYGRGVRFDVWGFGGPLARATAERFPEFSANMQWSWERTLYSAHRSHEPAGLTQLFSERGLPASAPAWSSEFFSNIGYLLRQHLGTDDETYLLLCSRMARNADGEIWPADVGGILKWFAHGMPVASAFPRGPASHVMLVNRVSLAGNWDPEKGESPDNRYHTETHHEGFAPLPALDYADVDLTITDTLAYGHDIRMPGNVPAFPERERTGKAPLRWHRQVMMVDDEIAGGAQYIVLRDTVASPQPTQWHFWSLTDKIGTPEAVSDRIAFLEDKPGEQITPLRELNGNRFTGIGQFGVDLEYYIAAPAKTPRFTMRYGLGGGAYGARAKNTFQDLMHLQLPGEGAYFVAIFPRKSDAAVPEFHSEGDGRVIRIRGKFGEDLAFLSHEPATAAVGGTTFEGMAGHVKDREGVLTLSLPSGGSVAHEGFRLRSGSPAQMVIVEESLTVHVPKTFEGGRVLFRSPEAVAPEDEDMAEIELTREDPAGWSLTLPPGARRVRFIR